MPARQVGQLPRPRLVDRAVEAFPLGAVRVDDGGRVLLQQLAANREHELVLLVALRLAVVVLVEAGVLRPAVQLRDVEEALAQRRDIGAGRGEEARDVPELPEVAAALVGRVLAPEQLAGELVVETDDVRLDELLVRLEQRDRVHLEQLDVGQEVLARQLRQRRVHRVVDLGVDHHLAEVLGQLVGDPGRDLEPGAQRASESLRADRCPRTRTRGSPPGRAARARARESPARSRRPRRRCGAPP